MSITDIVHEGLKEPMWKVSRGMTLLDMVKGMKRGHCRGSDGSTGEVPEEEVMPNELR